MFNKKVNKKTAHILFNRGVPILVKTFTNYPNHLFVEEQIITKDFDFDTFDESLECTGYFTRRNQWSKKEFVQGQKEYYIEGEQ